MKLTTDKKSRIFYLILGFYAVILFWITIFSRTATSYVYIYYPFKSYVELFSGDLSSCIFIIGNILLFIPAGYFAQTIFKTKLAWTVLVGFVISLLIEAIQLITRLGCFEFDDLLHNSLGTLIGSFIYRKFPLTISYNIKKIIRWLLLSIVITVIALISAIKFVDYIAYKQMVSFATLSDTAEHKNLLVLNGKEGNIASEIYITYMDDGQLRVTGSTDGVWIKIGELTLEPGTYTFGGATGIKKDTLSLVLQYYDEDKNEYYNLTPYIDSDVDAEFTLDKETAIRAYIRVYDVDNCDEYVRPVIYMIKN